MIHSHRLVLPVDAVVCRFIPAKTCRQAFRSAPVLMHIRSCWGDKSRCERQYHVGSRASSVRGCLPKLSSTTPAHALAPCTLHLARCIPHSAGQQRTRLHCAAHYKFDEQSYCGLRIYPRYTSVPAYTNPRMPGASVHIRGPNKHTKNRCVPSAHTQSVQRRAKGSM